jgi:DNA-binding transcriptional MerR regulator
VKRGAAEAQTMIRPSIHQLPRLGMSNAMRLFGLTARALRFYEERGLIEARRDRLNTRFYDPVARRRLEWISRLRRAGVSLPDIREVLHAEDSEERGRECALRKLESRREALQRDLAMLDEVVLELQSTAPALAVRAPGRAIG